LVGFFKLYIYILELQLFGTFKPHSKMMAATNFSLGRGGGIILVLKIVSALHHVVYQMIQYILYKGLLYFQKVIQFQGTYINVISFMPITKVQHLHDSFPQSSNAGRRDCVVSIATRYRLEGPGIENRQGGAIFHTHLDQSWGPPGLLHNGYRVSFLGVS
jgi:hypothetical protein